MAYFQSIMLKLENFKLYKALGTYKRSSRCNKPSWNLNLAWSLENLGLDHDFLIGLDANNKRIFQIFTNLTKKGCVIRNYQQHLKSKMFKLDNDITLLLVGYISPLRWEVGTMGQHIRFPLLVSKAIWMTNRNPKQGQCPSNLVLIQNTSNHEILKVLMIGVHNDFMLNSFK
jgi:hypothetical protein